MTTYHVAKTGSDHGPGTAVAPFLTIGRAAAIAVPGDTVLVHEGEYREWVRPRFGGLSDTRRITYAAADGEHVTIKGSERVLGWQAQGRGVWRADLPSAMFGDWNPYAIPVDGDWLVVASMAEPRKHLGDVYLDGESFFEVTGLDQVFAPPLRTTMTDEWAGVPVPVADPARTQRVWYAEAGDDTTSIWANFGDADPNAALAEINVRRSVFYPDRTGVDYITVRGFELAQAACPWAPPTADQPGLVGPNWAKGWIIEDNDIHDAKCSGISLGKEASTGDNWFNRRHDKPGYQYQLEAVFAARGIGWDKEHVGSHIVRRNTIHDCGQNGIVGHLGSVFSTIEDNHIYNIHAKHEFYGYEIAGIKLHAAIDVQIRRNRVHDCSLGIWLDWQAQGTRVTGNVCYRNIRDLFVEVSHGPYLVDHNVFCSAAALVSFSQGGAYVANLVGGTMRLLPVMNRATPYHRPHSTQVKGYAVIYGGDDRHVGNIFVGAGAGVTDDGIGADSSHSVGFGTSGYDGHPASWQEYLASVEARLPGDLGEVIDLKQPVYVRGNVYLFGARPYAREDSPLVSDADPGLTITEDGGGVWLDVTLPAGFDAHRLPVVTTAALPKVRFVDADYEAPDGSPLTLDTDLLGAKADGETVPGPILTLTAGHNRVKLA